MSAEASRNVKKHRKHSKGPTKYDFTHAGQGVVNTRNLINVQRFEIREELIQIKTHRLDIINLRHRNKGRLDCLIVPKLKLLWKLQNSLKVLSLTLKKLWYKPWASKRRQNLKLNSAILEIDISLIREEYINWERYCKDNCRVCHKLKEETCSICLNHRILKVVIPETDDESEEDEIVE